VLAALGGGWIKYALIALACALAFAYVRNMGVQSERAKWEAAVVAEQKRQDGVNEKWVAVSTDDADSIDERVRQLRSRRDEQFIDEGGDVVCLSDTAVMRLNSIR
jgi:hypothetical protein